MAGICRPFGAALLFSVLAAAQPVELILRRSAAAQGEEFHGAALSTPDPDGRRRIYTWGDRALSWTVPEGQASVLAEGEVRYPDGGCAADVNGDGRDDLVVLERTPPAATGTLVWIEALAGTRHLIDTGALFRDCIATEIDGRRGVLLLHRYAELRFYEFPADPTQPWPPRVIYSLYAASKQGGLLQADADSDGAQEYLFGNYWLRPPSGPDQSWRLYAVNLWNEEPDSALARLVWIPGSPGRLIAAQSERPDARLAAFTPPASPGSLWLETRLEGFLRLRYPRALTVIDLSRDGEPDIVAGEDAGPGSRLILFESLGRRFAPATLGTTGGLIALWPIGPPEGEGPVLAGVARDAILWWRVQPRR